MATGDHTAEALGPVRVVARHPNGHEEAAWVRRDTPRARLRSMFPEAEGFDFDQPRQRSTEGP